jgi:hypothetical protein
LQLSSFRHAAHLGLNRLALCASSESFVSGSRLASGTCEWRLREPAIVARLGDSLRGGAGDHLVFFEGHT